MSTASWGRRKEELGEIEAMAPTQVTIFSFQVWTDSTVFMKGNNAIKLIRTEISEGASGDFRSLFFIYINVYIQKS